MASSLAYAEGARGSGLSAALARATSPTTQQQWTCPCLNVRLSLAPGSTPSAANVDRQRTPWLAELASDHAINIQFPSLTSRETVTVADNSNVACAKCLNCDTIVYAATKPAPPGPARALGFNTASSNAAAAAAVSDAVKEPNAPVSPTSARMFRSPSREAVPTRAHRANSRSNEPLVRPLDRKVWILPDALSPQQASQAAGSDAFSPAFNVLVPRIPAASRALPLEEPAANGASASHADNARDATPTRPPPGAGARKSSYGAGASSIGYALPAVPQHLISTPPASPRIGAPASSATSPGATSSPAPSINPAIALPAPHPLASQLDSVAIERLKDMRSKAEAEVFELVRQKRREMELLEKRFREEAESLLSVTKTPRTTRGTTTNGSAAQLIQRALNEQQQQQQQQQQQHSSSSSSRPQQQPSLGQLATISTAETESPRIPPAPRPASPSAPGRQPRRLRGRLAPQQANHAATASTTSTRICRHLHSRGVPPTPRQAKSAPRSPTAVRPAPWHPLSVASARRSPCAVVTCPLRCRTGPKSDVCASAIHRETTRRSRRRPTPTPPLRPTRSPTRRTMRGTLSVACAARKTPPGRERAAATTATSMPRWTAGAADASPPARGRARRRESHANVKASRPRSCLLRLQRRPPLRSCRIPARMWAVVAQDADQLRHSIHLRSCLRLCLQSGRRLRMWTTDAMPTRTRLRSAASSSRPSRSPNRRRR